MKSHLQLRSVIPTSIIFALAPLMAITLGETSSLATEGAARVSMDKQMEELESLWSADKTNEYCIQAYKITHDMGQWERDYAPLSLAAKMRDAGKLLKSFVEKEFAVTGQGVGLLTETESLAMIITGEYQLPAAELQNLTSEERQAQSTLLAQYLGHVRSEIIPNFKPQRVFANVMPPAVPPGQMAVSGMDPNDISDPVARSNYVRAIQVNKENSVANTRQSLLGGIESQLSRRIVDHMIFTIQQSQVTPTLVTQWMDSAKLNDQERKEVKAALDKAASK